MQKALLSRCPIGIFAFSEGGELIFYRLFSRNPENALKEFLSDMKLKELQGYETENDCKFLRRNIRQYAINLGFCNTEKELNLFFSEFCMLLSKESLKGVIGRDKLVVQSSNALEDARKLSSLMLERLYEWYTLHYPECRLDKKQLMEHVIKYGKRENFPSFHSSSGVPLLEADEAMLKEYAKMAREMLEREKMLEKYVKTSMKEIMPNFCALVDPLLASRFLSHVGSMEKLARLPSSAIQLMGSEKALFRHLKNKKKDKSPKFGIIFLSSWVQNAKEKGKAARLLASKLMIAAKIDFYSGRDESERLKRDLIEEMKRV
jgi:nucleolar protein 56